MPLGLLRAQAMMRQIQKPSLLHNWRQNRRTCVLINANPKSIEPLVSTVHQNELRNTLFQGDNYLDRIGIVCFIPPYRALGFKPLTPGRRCALPWAVLFRPVGAAKIYDALCRTITSNLMFSFYRVTVEFYEEYEKTNLIFIW